MSNPVHLATFETISIVENLALAIDQVEEAKNKAEITAIVEKQLDAISQYFKNNAPLLIGKDYADIHEELELTDAFASIPGGADFRLEATGTKLFILKKHNKTDLAIPAIFEADKQFTKFQETIIKKRAVTNL